MSIVIIPAFQPSEILIKLVENLWGMGCRVVVVDDGSGKTYQGIFDRIKDISVVLRHLDNQGKGAAIKTALRYIQSEMWNYEAIGVMDADGQHLPEDMLRVLEYARMHKDALVLGVRHVGKEMPLRSRLGNEITRVIFRLISGVKVSDTQTGLRAFTSELTERLLEIPGERYEYEMNVLLAMAKEKIPIEEIGIETIYNEDHDSFSHFRTVKDSARIYKDLFKFTLASFSSFLIDYILFVCLVYLFPEGAGYVLAANVIARVLSAFYNFSINCRYVFHAEQKSVAAVEYFMLALFILGMNNIILEIFTLGFRIPVYPAKIMTECTLFVISWTVQKCLIFRKKMVKMVE